MLNQIRTKPLIFNCQISAFDIRDKEVRDQNASNTTNSSDDERPSLSEVVLNWRERFCAHCGSCLPQRRTDPVTGTSDSCSIALATEQAEHVPWTQVA